MFRSEPANFHLARNVHHRTLGRLQAHGDGSRRTTLLMISPGMCNYGAVLRIEVARQLGSGVRLVLLTLR